MKKNAYIVGIILSVILMACKNEQTFKVEGEVTGAAEKTLYLEQSALGGIVTLDSTELGSHGTFSFEGERPSSPEFYRLRIDNKIINFSADSTETITVHADFPTFATDYRIEGSETNLKIKELSLLQAELQKGIDSQVHGQPIICFQSVILGSLRPQIGGTDCRVPGHKIRETAGKPVLLQDLHHRSFPVLPELQLPFPVDAEEASQHLCRKIQHIPVGLNVILRVNGKQFRTVGKRFDLRLALR